MGVGVLFLVDELAHALAVRKTRFSDNNSLAS